MLLATSLGVKAHTITSGLQVYVPTFEERFDWSLNYGGNENAEVPALLAAWRAASGDSRAAAAETLFTAMAADLPFAPLCFKDRSLLVRWGMVESLAPVWGAPFAGVENWQTN